MSLEESLCQLGTINLPLGTHQAHKLAVEHQFADQPAKAGLKRRHLRPIHALSFGQPYGFILNFWQRYASHATAVPEACVANKGHAGVSVAKLSFKGHDRLDADGIAQLRVEVHAIAFPRNAMGNAIGAESLMPRPPAR